jgi:hypothetical protein
MITGSAGRWVARLVNATIRGDLFIDGRFVLERSGAGCAPSRDRVASYLDLAKDEGGRFATGGPCSPRPSWIDLTGPEPQQELS